MTDPAVLISPILLLVEDDAGIQPILEDALAEAGFEVVTADSGTAAITELDANGSRFAAVITDIRLGKGPSGWEVGHRAREIVSGIPVIYISGDSAHEWSANGVPESIMLQKPFVIAQLITAVTTLLNNAGSVAALSGGMTNDAKTMPSSD
jgi:DNA-binding response OmpR family regulator